MSSIRRSADIQLRAQGVRESSQVLLYVQIGSNGRVLHCGNSKREDDPLVDAACVVAEDATWEVVHDQNGVAVPYVRHLHVQFDPDTDEGEGVANP